MTGLAAAKGLFVADGGGAARTVTVTDLPFRPRAVVAWWTGQAAAGIQSGNQGGVGFWTDETSICVAWASHGGGPKTSTAHAADTAALLGIEGMRQRVCMRAEPAVLAVDGFSISWTTAPDRTWIVQYLALGGESLTRASAGWLASPARAGHTELELAGIEPDLVLFAPTAAEAASKPVSGLSAGIGAAARKAQAAAAYSLGSGLPGGSVVGAQRTDAAILVTGDRTGTEAVGSVRLNGPGRATIEWSRVPATPRLVCYLALEGVRCKIGTTEAPARPTRRGVRVGFRPEALLFFSWGFPASGEPRNIGRLCVGGATAHGRGSAGWDDINVEGAPVAHVSSSTDVVVVTDTQTGRAHAAAALESITGTGFTLDWRESDRPRREIVYVALAAKRRAGLVASLRRRALTRSRR